MHLKFFILSWLKNTNSEITNFCLEKKNQPLSFLLKQSLLRFHIPNRKNFLRSTKSMKTKIYKPNWGYWRVSLSSGLSSFFPYCILQRNKALSSLPYCVSQHNKENFQRDTPITSSNCPQRGHTSSTADDARRANSWMERSLYPLTPAVLHNCHFR